MLYPGFQNKFCLLENPNYKGVLLIIRTFVPIDIDKKHQIFTGMRTVRHSQSRKTVCWILNGAKQIFRSLIKSLN